MAIIISKNGGNAQKIEKSGFGQEDYLQRYIYNNPESLPLYEIKEDIRLFIVAREFPTNSGPIDALGIDRDGELYLIETKLYKNPDKRLVVAQVLDYGASLWHGYNDFSEFLRIIDNQINEKFNVSLNQKLKEFFNIVNEDVSTLIENVKRNLNEGNFRFVVLMDKLHSQLKDLIIFINQNSRFDILGVELEYYKYEDYEILIPRIFGSETKKNMGVRTASGTVWDEKKFFYKIEDEVSDKEIIDIIKKLYEFTQRESSSDPWLKQPTKYGTFNFYVRADNKNYSLFNIRRYGTIYFYGLQQREGFRKDLQNIGMDIPDDAKEKEFKLDIFKEKISLEEFKKVVKKLVL